MPGALPDRGGVPSFPAPQPPRLVRGPHACPPSSFSSGAEKISPKCWSRGLDGQQTCGMLVLGRLWLMCVGESVLASGTLIRAVIASEGYCGLTATGV